MHPFARTLRVRQIQFCARWLRRLSAVPATFAIVKALRDRALVKPVLEVLLQYNRPFRSLAEAAAAAAGYEGGGHSHPRYLRVKIPEAEVVRPGDYPALFYIQKHLAGIARVFDLGGSVGNLFYCYVTYLDIPPGFTWTVFDLPTTIELGAEIAKERGETRLRFTGDINEARSADLFITSGALQYFEQNLPEMLAGFGKLPRYVLVNREPLVDGPAIATVVDGDGYRLPSVLHDRRELVAGMETLGYQLVDGWVIKERSLIIPGYPDLSARSYSGMFFQLCPPAAPASRD
jgi:putative methyltransferase (TIGR04325 family)